jgi:AraC-like DNA-binding protein
MKSDKKNRTVSAIAVIDLANELLSRKLISPSQLSVSVPEYVEWTQGALTTNILTIQEARIAEHRLVDLWQLADQASSKGAFGLDIGTKVNEKAKGLLANWLSQSETLGQALEIFRQNIALLNPSEQWVLTFSDDRRQARLEFDFISPFEYPRMAYERSMLALLAWGDYLCGQKIHIQEAEFTFPEPPYHDRLVSVLGKNIHYGRPQNGFLITADIFSRPLTSANTYLHSIMSQRAHTVLNSLVTPRSFSERVSELIRSDIRLFSQIETLAAALCMSRATLYRKLKADNTSFQMLLNNERKHAAQKALEERQKVEVITYHLGFKDKRSFYKAYKRWFNRRPSESDQNRA